MTEMFAIRGSTDQNNGGYIANKTIIVQDPYQFAVWFEPSMDVSKGTVLFFSRSKAEDVRTQLDQTTKKVRPDFAAKFDVEKVHASDRDVRFMMKNPCDFMPKDND